MPLIARRRRPVVLPRTKLVDLAEDGFVQHSLEEDHGLNGFPEHVAVRFLSLTRLLELLLATFGETEVAQCISDNGDCRGWQHVENMRRNLVLWLPRPSERKDPRRIMRVLLAPGPGLVFDWKRWDAFDYAPYAAAHTATTATMPYSPLRLPPIVLSNGAFVDGRHRILAAWRANLAGLPVVDLGDLCP